ncbi:hypothetical protein B0H14DRAFT_1241714 [Mycena olivaceomarginata]|nr:hypothetical protein B0H14DRAFT_3569314 [Mycena olivaceomarginata]KAJ7827018.1 hypothetical protein B0H14DRAFT_1241714 [Mycena olivaceomarginata]
MSGVQLLVPDIIREIMLWLPSDIDQKFRVAQVSRYWRDTALHHPLFWSSFLGRTNQLYINRIPIVLERSGTTLLHIELLILTGLPGPDTDWLAKAFAALLPYVARIETLDIELSEGYLINDTFPPSPETIEPLLRSNLEFSSLKTLRLVAPYSYEGYTPRILLKAPRLQTLDMQYFVPDDLGALLSPGLENIRLYEPRIKRVETLFHIFTQCAKARRVALLARDGEEQLFGSFAVQQPFAPALRELEIGLMKGVDIAHILTTWLSDVVLHKLTVWPDYFDPRLEVLIPASLRGVGPLITFDDLDDGHPFLAVGDEGGRIRCFRNINEDAWAASEELWELLSSRYNLHKTVREIRITSYWDNYVDIFERHPPQHAGITLVIAADTDFDTGHMVPTDAPLSDDNRNMSKPMRIAGLAKVKFYGPRAYLRVATITHVLAHIEPPAARQVEVCVGNRRLVEGGIEQEVFNASQTALSGDSCWTICSQCLSRHAH